MQILVIEDEQRLARSIQKGLKNENYCVDAAFDGEEGISKMNNQYDLIILDIMMPNKNGLEVIEWIRLNDIKTPVLMLTAKGTISDKVKGLEMGADDYLTKPFDFAELLARVKALIRRSNGTNNILQIDNLELDLNTKIVSRGGLKIDLASTEYRLLEYMMSHPGKVMNESELLEHVWDHNYDGLSNVVAVYIRYLRNKIDKPFEDDNNLIKTVRGLGYKIDDNV